MNIAISGATGFIGSRLTQYLTQAEHNIIAIDRELLQDNNRQQLQAAIEQCEIVVNLAGAPVNHRWDKAYKRQIYNSRIETTRKIVDAINSSQTTSTMISTSAIGYYPSSGCHNEQSQQRGSGFLSDVCFDWEQQARQVSTHVRLAIIRLGIVLGEHGGAFEQISRPAKMGIATIIANGTQPFSWIGIEDLVRAIGLIAENSSMDGVFNLTAPEQIDQRRFTHAIAQHYGARFTIRVPRLAFRLIYGKASQFIVEGQCAPPQHLLECGFRFDSPNIDEFLSRLPNI